MAKRVLVADGEQPRTAEQLAEMCGYKNAQSVYACVAAQRPVGRTGKVWTWQVDPDGAKPAAEPRDRKPMRDTIICRCPECGGKEWRAGEIMQKWPNATKGRITRASIAGVSEATGHAFEYLSAMPSGKWLTNAAGAVEWLPDGVNRRDWFPPAAPPEWEPKERNTDPGAYDVYALNPKGPGIITGKWGIPRASA
jgi:hypothetical protein